MARRLVQEQSAKPPAEPPPNVDEVADELRDRIALKGARLSDRQNCAAMQRVHISAVIGKRRVDSVSRQDIERLARAMLARGSAPKTVRDVMTFLHSVFVLAIKNGWVPRATRIGVSAATDLAAVPLRPVALSHPGPVPARSPSHESP